MSENELLIKQARVIAEGVGKTLSPLVEVVLHDLTKPEHSIVFIENNLSGRSLGEPATELGRARIADPNFPEIVQNYANRFPDGRPAKSTSIGIKNSKGEYVAAVCLNMDISMLTSTAIALNKFVHADEGQDEISESLTPQQKSIQETIQHYAASLNTTPRALNVAQRRAVVATLVGKGLMALKNAQRVVAKALGIARSTVYTYISGYRSC